MYFKKSKNYFGFVSDIKNLKSKYSSRCKALDSLTMRHLFAGYGHMVPKTTGGRAFCMVFALVGIPGTCLVLQAVGDKISEFVAAVIITIEKKCFRRTRPKHVYIKTTVTTFVLTFFVVLPGLAIPVKIRREKWSYFECFYFNFITLSTIGFGDFVPEFHRGYDFLLVSVAFVGLSFVSSILCSLNVLIEKYGIGARFVTNRREEKNAECEEAQEDFFKVCEHFCDVDKQGVGQGKNTETKMESSTEDQKSSEMKRCRHDDSTRCEGCYRDSIQLSMFTA